THVVDVASTAVPAYAPRIEGEEPLDDETTSYYWAVIPVIEGVANREPPLQDAPRTFDKFSESPCEPGSGVPCGPSSSVVVHGQPTFRWNPAEGALSYTLQVATDETFSNPVATVTTTSTAYTSVANYPANSTLFWRVRASDTNARNPGLNWSCEPFSTFP